ncbi:insulinase family protein [Colwellia sp. MB3u-70]|uniref:insulinase family protein n=1 Tax=unclassified Colwellia TaxID=196834 RepID=UPI0015F6A525|nr:MULTISPECIES: insulinase family protein [unclassified Colwellia]MBA6291036.1 insulinase family protein [Colwellia sp. MB3u-8]MBA6308245.1 insulinase family protein [Colwellia sp. MB3u-70]
MIEAIYRHKNGLKHINILNNDGFSALFVVNTPIFDNSGVAHAVEHMVFRRSTAFPKAETLFQLTSLTDAKINASTLAKTTYFHCQSQCSHTFMLAIDYLLNGLFNPIFDAEDLHCELHDGNDRGVIYQELIGAEQANKESPESRVQNNNLDNNQNDFCYGGTSATIGKLSLKDLTTFHQRLYQATKIILVTANADSEQIANLIALLPKPANQSKQSKQTKVALDKNRKQSKNNVQENAQGNESNAHHQKKYSPAINTLITSYHLWLQDPYYQEIDDYGEIQSTNTQFKTNTESLPTQPSSNLISPLITLSNTLIKDVSNDLAIDVGKKCIDIKQSANKTSLPNLFTKLYQQAKKQLTINELINESSFQRNQVCVSDQRNALWLTDIAATEKILATITSYIISAYPIFLAPRCQGLCYATQALTIEKSAYFVIYSAFDVNPNTRLKAIPLCLLTLSQDKNFISMSLALVKIKYCQAYHLDNSQLINITSSAISAYLQVLANSSHPKV